ncbi:helix-turn-helix transcriptional regulator [Candidatus Daviesbacteria bacterium]|nr:helix-turn-helix transcriptional regulator [Candidatus Daviesbacteria bacterium]
MSKEVVASYSLKCEGVSPTEVAPLLDHPAEPSLTIFKDGSRSVGCPYLFSGVCYASESSKSICTQLFPETNTGMPQQFGQHDRPLKNDVVEVDGERLGSLRLQHHLTLRILGRAARISVSTLSQLENGKTTRLGHPKAERLAHALGVDLEQFRQVAQENK